MLTVNNLSKSFKIGNRLLQAVRDVTFSIKEGETLAVVGESGSGKSTIAHLVLALEEPTGGSLAFEGERLSAKRSLLHRRDIQIVFQDPHSSFNPRMRIKEALFEPFYVQNIYRTFEEAEPLILETLQFVRMGKDVLERFPHTFSGGQLQRLAIARALLLKPKLLVLDEPLSSLDLSQQAQILGLLEDLRQTLKLTLLFITHDLKVVEAFADRVIVLYLGKVMEEGTTEAVFQDPRHPYTQALLSSIPPKNPWEKRDPMPIGNLLPSPFDPPSGCPFRTRCPFTRPECADPIQVKSEGSHRWWCIFEKIGSL